jgi:hypothetical protein
VLCVCVGAGGLSYNNCSTCQGVGPSLPLCYHLGCLPLCARSRRLKKGTFVRFQPLSRGFHEAVGEHVKQVLEQVCVSAGWCNHNLQWLTADAHLCYG